ncbi:unnamed protein product [Amoebophrya sp. A120]|nr:unnamed protein product [Amoebophrya sp. A120]|eukprot:GSA120T00019403001.1
MKDHTTTVSPRMLKEDFSATKNDGDVGQELLHDDPIMQQDELLQQEEQEDVSDIGIRDLLHWVTPKEKRAYYFGSVNAVFFGFLQPAMVYYLGEVFDVAAQRDPNDTKAFADKIQEILWIWGVISVLNWVTAQFYMWSFEWAVANQLYTIRKEYFEKVLYHDCEWFDAKDPLTVPSRLMVDIRKIKEALGSKMAMAIMNVAQFFAGVFFGFIVNAELTAVCCILLPLMVYATYLFATALTGYSQWMAKYYIKSGAVADEIFANVKTVVANNAEARELQRYEDLLKPARVGKARVAVRVGFQLGCMDACCFLVYALCFWYGSRVIADDGKNEFDNSTLDGSDVMKVVFNLVIGAFGLGQVAPAIQAYAEAKPALKNMKKLREEWEWKMRHKRNATPSCIGIAGNGRKGATASSSYTMTTGGDIVAKAVSFQYPTRLDAPKVLSNVNFEIKAGSKVAFVGESGSGKSTIIQLLERFYDIGEVVDAVVDPALAAGGQQGTSLASSSLSIGGIELKDMSMKELRKQIGYVQQEPVLFECSLRENLLSGLENEDEFGNTQTTTNVTEADLIFACKQAQIWDLIQTFPDKLDTLPGQGGSQLSGGQKQRIAIARALVRKPKILLLDEATSALDYASEKEVQRVIDQIGTTRTSSTTNSAESHKMTVVIVAHRLSTVRNCDKIFFLNRGEILETGTHEELLALKGGYFKLVETQAMYDALQERSGSKMLMNNTITIGGQQENELDVEVPRVEETTATTNYVNTDGAGATTNPLSTSSHDQAALENRSNSKDSKRSTSSKDKTTSKDEKDGELAAIVPSVLKSAEEKEAERIEEIAKSYQLPLKRLLQLNTASELMFYPLGFMFSLINGSMQPTMMWIMMDAVEYLYYEDKAKMQDGVNEFCLKAVGLAVCLQLGFTCSNACYGYVGSWMTYRARILIFKTYLQQDMSFFDMPENSSGRLTALLEKQSADLGFLSGEAFGSRCEMLSSITLGLTFAFFASWKLALVVLAVLPLLMASMMLMMVAFLGSMETVTTDSPEVVASGNVIAEAVLNIKTVKALTAEGTFLSKFDKMVFAISEKERKKAFWTGLAFGFSNGIMGLVFILSFWYGAELVKDEGLSPTDMFKAVMCIFFAGMAAGQAAATVPNTARALAAAHDIFALVDRVPLIDNTEEGNSRKYELVPTSSESSKPFDAVRFEKNVQFAYPQRPELTILDLAQNSTEMVFAYGKSIALAGPSGSGKSTVMALLQRFYDPVAGEVNVVENREKKSIDLKDLNLKSWREKIGYVGQEPVLFNMSARENILYGIEKEKRKAVDLELLAKQCHLDFLAGAGTSGTTKASGTIVTTRGISTSSPATPSSRLSWDEKLGPKGSKISGGQKQRIAIARALARNPSVLLLDEATSALDAVSEKEVQAALEEIQNGAAGGANTKFLTVTIAHRLSTIANSDNILVMCDGAVLEQGSHAELSAKQDGLYYKLVQTSSAAM